LPATLIGSPVEDEAIAPAISPLGNDARSCVGIRIALAATKDRVRLTYMGVEELQSAVSQLPVDDLDRFSRWFEEFLADQWDRRIEADIRAGRLDAAGRRAECSQARRAER
jgi:hypothetical protein